MPPAPALLPMPTGIDRPELTTRDLMSAALGGRIDPLPRHLAVRHAGAAVSAAPPRRILGRDYIFPESEIGFWNQDTLGNRNLIPPGALHLTVAGAGVMHEETVVRSGKSALGLQIWIDHADADREVAPAALHLAPGDVPTVARDGVVRRLLLGASGGLASPLAALLSARIIDVDMQAGATLEEAVAAGETAFAVIREGRVRAGAGAAGPATAVFAGTGPLQLAASTAARLTIFGGPPLRHAAVPAGPFVASTEAQARTFRARFAEGGMGSLTAFDQAALDRDFDRTTNQ